jgi:hypothetical protein
MDMVQVDVNFRHVACVLCCFGGAESALLHGGVTVLKTWPWTWCKKANPTLLEFHMVCYLCSLLLWFCRLAQTLCSYGMAHASWNHV